MYITDPCYIQSWCIEPSLSRQGNTLFIRFSSCSRDDGDEQWHRSGGGVI